MGLAACGSDDDDADADGDTGDDTADESGDGGDGGDGADADGGDGGDGGEPQDGGTVVIVFPRDMAEDMKSLDPQLGQGTFTHTILSNMYDTLVVQHPDTGEILPHLAESFEVSDDGTEYTFKLRQDVTFHDGTPFNAEAVKFTLDRAAGEELLPESSSVKSRMAGYVETEIVDDYTVIVRTENPIANFLSGALARSVLGIVSPTAVEASGVPGFGRDNPVGTGAFMFEEWVDGSHISVVRNPDYNWAYSFLDNQGPPRVERLEFRYIAEDSTRAAALLSGEADIIEAVPAADQERIADNAELDIFEAFKNGTPGRLEIQVQSGPTRDVAVRQALNMATDREALNDIVFNGFNRPAYTVYEESMFCQDPDIRFPSSDLASAITTLEEAGWVAGGDGIREKDGERLTLRVITVDEVVPVVELLQAQWLPAGIEVEIMPMPGAAHQEAEAAGDFELSLRPNYRGWTNEDPDIIRRHLHSSLIPPDGTSNPGRVSYPDLDALLEQGRATTDDSRCGIYEEIQQFIVDEALFVPLLHFNTNAGHKATVKGQRYDARGTYRYYHDLYIEQ